ncbi:MAG TPA: SCP2 sterol-binding domain-containing protein [Candidatus Anoxymicrobiaceae bacterium]|jgi:putative sterol carrier protein
MIEAKEDVTVDEYFNDYVPKIFAEQLQSTAVSGMDDTQAKIVFNISGREPQTWSIVIKDAKDLKVVQGPVTDPLVTLDMDEGTWRDAVTGKLPGAIDMFTDVNKVANRVRFDKISDMKGTLVLNLARADGSPIDLAVTFNGAERPKATFTCSIDCWKDLSSGKVTGVTAFMGGQLKIEGDMPFAIELSNLVG